jgi:hypothetical protein
LEYLNFISIIKKLKISISEKKTRFKIFEKNKVKKNIYKIELKIIFLKKTEFTLKECSINETRPNFDLSKYLLFLFA